MRILLLTFMITLPVFAQHTEQPQKENTDDLRTSTVLFSIEDVKEKRLYWLERTPALDHFLRMKKGSEEILMKTDSRDAKKLDMDFAAKFLRCQYELASEAGKCDVLYKLNMKGEEQEICAKDEKKSQEMRPILKELSKRF